MSEIKHDAAFELEVLAHCLRDVKYMREAAAILDRTHFEIKEHGWIWKVIKETWAEYGELPNNEHIVSEARRDFSDPDDRVPYLEAVKKVRKKKATAPKSSLGELRKFVRMAALEAALYGSAGHLQKGNWDEAYEPIAELMKGDLRAMNYSVSRWSEETGERQKDRRERKLHPERFKTIPTGFRTLDKRIVGMQENEFGLILGFTGRGKSIFANHIGFQAICRGFNVVHFSTEMAASRVAQRYDSRFSGIKYKTFKHYLFSEEELEEYEELAAQGRKRFDGRLRIISTPLRYCDINMIKTALDDMCVEMRDNRIDMVIVDSGDHMQPIGRVESYRLAQASVYTDLKNLAEEFGYVVWSTSHIGREWEHRTATVAAISESLDKGRLADIVISLNKPQRRTAAAVVTSDSGEDEGEGEEGPTYAVQGDLEGFVPKVRDDEDKFYFQIEADLSRMLMKEMDTEE